MHTLYHDALKKLDVKLVTVTKVIRWGKIVEGENGEARKKKIIPSQQGQVCMPHSFSTSLGELVFEILD